MEDVEEARRIRDILKGTGWQCFLAQDNLHEELHAKWWARGINEALDETGVVLALMSPGSIHSQWVRFEWENFHLGLLRGREGGLIPCCIKNLDPDDLCSNPLRWLPNVIRISTEAAAVLVRGHFRRVYDTAGVPVQYVRLDFDLGGEAVGADDFAPRTLDGIEAVGRTTADAHDDRLETLADLLHRGQAMREQ